MTVAYHDSVVLQFDSSTTGNAGAGIPIAVYDTGTSNYATIYDLSDVQIVQPALTTDGKGNYVFKAAEGTYDIVIKEGTSDEERFDQITLGGSGGGGSDIFVISNQIDAYTLTNANSSNYIVFNTALEAALTVPVDLDIGFTCAVANKGAGGVDILTTDAVLGEINLLDKDGVMSLTKIADGEIQTSERLLDNIQAVDVNYDNASSGLVATDVKAAIDELKALIDALTP